MARLNRIATAVAIISLSFAPLYGQGTILQSSGPINQSMGGASVAAPIDAIGALYWNPASISGMERSETAFSMGLLTINHEVSSSFGPFSGTTEGDSGTFPIPNIGWVHRTANPAVTLGFGVNTIAGFGANLPADPSNPALAPAPTGLGRVSSNGFFLQMAPVLSVAVTEKLSIAAGPTITAGRVGLEPFVFASANTNGEYSPGHATKYHWGGGFQLGTYYIHDDCWRYGASFKSPAWMEEFEFHGEDASGGPRELTAKIDLPMIVSVGTSYAGWEDWLFALDVRYFDYANTDGFGDPATFDATGRLSGLDFSSIVALGTGVERKIGDRLAVRGGYAYNQNPIKNSEAFYNVASPLMYQHILGGGATFEVSEDLAASVAYSYYFENTRSGQIVAPGIGPVPGTTFDNSVDVHLVSFGLTVRN